MLQKICIEKKPNYSFFYCTNCVVYGIFWTSCCIYWSNVIPDLGFFTTLEEQTEFLSLIIIILGLSLTISTVDTLVNAISSLIVVDGKATFNLNKKINYLKLSKYFMVGLSIVAFIIASKGFSVCIYFYCSYFAAFVLTVFSSFYNKKFDEKTHILQ